MIAIATEGGSLVKVVSDGIFGFHELFGFISEEAFEQRIRSRKSKGLAVRKSWLCRFRVTGGALEALEGCTVARASGAAWDLATDFGKFLVREHDQSADAASVSRAIAARSDKSRDILGKAVIGTLLLALLLLYFAPTASEVVVPQVIEPIEVQIVKEAQKPVVVPAYQAMPQVTQQIQDKQVRRAVEQNLGFLGILGRKDLTKVLGGAPTLKDASAGAGAGGHEGSGGELLVGLGEGVKRTTVGNSGLKGLGGIGSKGAGGGAGGYGNSMIGSGEGRALSSVPLSQDMILEGGLDRSVIQATIAKYLSQVRACYENGLRKNPGIAGQVSMDFQIGPSGSLNYSRVSKSSLGNPEVEGCIATRMMGWKFPKPLGGVSVKVNYPFLLRPVGA